MNQIVLIILAVLAIMPLYGIVKLLRDAHQEQQWHNNRARELMQKHIQIRMDEYEYQARRDRDNAEAEVERILD